MLNKRIIIAVAAVMMASIGAGTAAYLSAQNNADVAVSSEAMSMAESKTVSIDTTPIDEAVSRGIEQIQSVVSAAIQQIENKIVEQKQASSAPAGSKTESEPATPKTATISVAIQTGNDTLIFNSVETVPSKNRLLFYYDFQYGEKGSGITIPTGPGTELIDTNGNKYYTENFGHSAGKGVLIFDDVTDYSALSNVTLTCAFLNRDPVTVTFDIPGL